jgi:hypothetical protein
MALITEVIDRTVFEAIFPAPVGAVAGAAFHFAFPYGMVRREFGQHLHLPVAVVTERRLPLIQHLFLSYLMGLVALIASHIMQGMKVAFPAEQRIIPVAGQADGRALRRFKPVKTDGLFALAFGCHVGTARAMASLTSSLLTGNLKCPDPIMNGLAVVLKHIIMANGTFFRTDVGCIGYKAGRRQAAAV